MKLTGRGLTLVEVLMSLVISTILIAGMTMTYLVTQRAWTDYSKNIVFKQQLRKALFLMTQELREGKDLFFVKKPGELRLSFYRPGVGVISYLWSEKGQLARTILRQTPSETTILAKEIAVVRFEQPTSDTLEIELTAGGSQLFSLRESVALRNRIPLFKPVGGRHAETQ